MKLIAYCESKGQRRYTDEDVPKAEEKIAMYSLGNKMLTEMGFESIGMDHFALKTDSMYHSFKKGKLHRNFMGYTTTNTKVMIGLGVSSISDSWNAFAQNERVLEDYFARLDKNEIPILKGHILTDEDLIIRQHILNIMCQFETSWSDEKLQFSELPEVIVSLSEMEEDELLILNENQLIVTEKGKPFVRNICMAFDLHLKRKAPERQLFSMTI